MLTLFLGRLRHTKRLTTPPVVTDNYRWVITAETTIFQNAQLVPNIRGIRKEDRIDEVKTTTKKQKKQNNNNNNKKNKKQQKKQQQKKKKKKQATRPALAARTAGACPTICQSSRTPRHWKLPSTIARRNHPIIFLFLIIIHLLLI